MFKQVTKTNDYFENSNFCRYLVAEQKFTAQITKIELIKNLNDNFAITIDFNMTFPKSLVPGNAVKILNLGVLRLNDTEITGVKISNLKNINQSLNQSVKVALILNNLELHGREFVELTFGVL